MSRKETRKKKNRSNVRKFLAGTLTLIIIIGSGIQVSFADQDISSLLSNWFHKKTDDSIEEIDKAISIEQKKQTERLKEELRLEIESAEKRLHEFVDAEKSKRTVELEKYADELISHSGKTNNESENEITDELDRILQEAKDEMSKVGATKAIEIEQENEGS